MRTEITKLHQRLQTTFIYVTHDQTEAMTMGSRICIMKDGFIQQVDTPQNNYDYPNNKFVAGFIGSPQMNFFDVTLKKQQDGKVYALFGENKILIPEEKLRRFKDEDHIGKEVIMGIRPENITDNPELVAAHPEAGFKVYVEVTELMGSETYLYLSTSGKEDNVIARVDPRTKTHIGDSITSPWIPPGCTSSTKTLRKRCSTVNLYFLTTGAPKRAQWVPVFMDEVSNWDLSMLVRMYVSVTVLSGYCGYV